MQNPHQGHRSRVKQEFLEIGMSHFPDHKKLELLLYYSQRRGDTNPLGHELMERFGSLSGVLDAPYDLLIQTSGIGAESATFLKIISAIIHEYMNDLVSQNNMIRDTESAKKYVQYRFLGEQKECIYMVCLGNNGRVVFSSRIAEGSPESVSISAAQVIRTAIRADAMRVILAHNHPHGFCNPSSKDLRTTNILHEELKRVEVDFFDHIIVAADGVYSMLEHGMFPASR